MVYVNFVNGDIENFEIKKDCNPWEWIPEQQAYLIQSIEGEVIIPAAFVKYLRHIEVNK